MLSLVGVTWNGFAAAKRLQKVRMNICFLSLSQFYSSLRLIASPTIARHARLMETPELAIGFSPGLLGRQTLDQRGTV